MCRGEGAGFSNQQPSSGWIEQGRTVAIAEPILDIHEIHRNKLRRLEHVREYHIDGEHREGTGDARK